MGEAALKSHLKGKKHQRAIEETKKTPSASFWKNIAIKSANNATSINSVQSTSDTTKPSVLASPSAATNMSKFVVKEEAIISEIRWTLRTVEKNLPFRSNDGISDFLRLTFLDSPLMSNIGLLNVKIVL